MASPYSLSLKFFMLTQMGFWVHCYPELVFMKAKKVYSVIVLSAKWM